MNGTYIAEDTGGVVKGNIIDIYMDSYDQAIKWGRRDVQVMVLE
ncbi:MAG: 3D domain-containing protein [Ignavibacteriales bacterium]